MNKITIAVLYGGISPEHEVSVHSAEDVCKVLTKKHRILPIYISKEGDFFLQQTCGFKKPTDIKVNLKNHSKIISEDGKVEEKIALFFPVLHGPYGEDGKIQGILESYGCKYIGCGVKSSFMSMDKAISKEIAQGLQILTLEHIEISNNYDLKDIKQKVERLGYPIFVKPVNLGSSIGISKVKTEKDLESATKKALKYESRVILEKGIDNPREIFCALLEKDNGEVVASKCGELLPSKHEFFDYEAKYQDPRGCIAKTPADIDYELAEKMQKFSTKIFASLKCQGFSRVDFLVTDKNEIYFSEINSIPGMSEKSLFPQLFSASKISYEDLLNTMVSTALATKK